MQIHTPIPTTSKLSDFFIIGGQCGLSVQGTPRTPSTQSGGAEGWGFFVPVDGFLESLAGSQVETIRNIASSIIFKDLFDGYR